MHHLLWLRQLLCLVLLQIADGAVVEGEELAEGTEVIFVPLGDLAPSAYVEGMNLLAEHAFDAFDLGEFIGRLAGEVGGMLEGFVKGPLLVLQGFEGVLGFGNTFGRAG